jgi:adenylate cyclase
MGEKLLIAFHINNNSIKDVAIKVSKVAHFIATNDKLCFNVSVGVNCGQVISGYLGVGEKRDFTIIGDPVNVTARIDSLAEKLDADRCLVSESIYNYICENVEAKLFGEVELKGKSVPMKVYQLI